MVLSQVSNNACIELGGVANGLQIWPVQPFETGINYHLKSELCQF